jgi:guanylate kinase
MTYTVDLFSAQLEQIQKELKNSRAELDRSISPGLFDHLLVNDDLETWYEKFEGTLPNLFTMQDSNYDPHLF